MTTKRKLRLTGISRHREGMALYVSVMMTTLIVSLLGIAGIAVVRIERISASQTTDMLVARLNAQSALQQAIVVLNNDSSWRSNYTSGVETTPQYLDVKSLGTISWILADSDGDLTDSDTKLTLQGIGRVGDAVQVVQVELNAGKLTCLEAAVHADYQAWIENTVLDVLDDEIISSNYIVIETGTSTVNGSVEAVTYIAGGGYTGSTTTGITPRTMPGSDVFDYYLANGTTIDYDSLSGGKIEDTLLSPDYNPYGATNPQGIYVIDCNYNKIEIKNSAILGTIVLIDPKSDSKIGNNHVYWQPAVSNFPALLVSGPMTFQVESGDALLDDIDSGGSSLLTTLFGGVMTVEADDIVSDLPSELNGLFYATGDIAIESQPSKFTGVIVGEGTVHFGVDTEVEYSSTFYDNPPPGFMSSEVSIISGSRTRVEAP